MKKQLAALVMAAAMLQLLGTAAFAARQSQEIALSGSVQVENGQTSVEENDYALSVDTNSHKAVFDSGVPVLYTYGPKQAGPLAETGGREAAISIIPQKLDSKGKVVSNQYRISRISAKAQTKNIAVTVRKNDGTIAGNKVPPTLAITSKAGPDVCELEDYEIMLDITIGEISKNKLVNKKDIVVTIKGKDSVAYARSREVEEDDTYTIAENTGSVFEFRYTIDEESRIRCEDNISVLVRGNYGRDFVNMRVDTSPIDAIEKKFPDASVQYFNFIGKPFFATNVAVQIEGPKDAHIYEYDAASGKISKVSTQFDDEEHLFTAKALGCYFMSDKDYTDE